MKKAVLRREVQTAVFTDLICVATLSVRIPMPITSGYVDVGGEEHRSNRKKDGAEMLYPFFVSACRLLPAVACFAVLQRCLMELCLKGAAEIIVVGHSDHRGDNGDRMIGGLEQLLCF